MAKKNDKKDNVLDMLQVLGTLGDVQIINDNLLIFTVSGKKGVYLRYSIGDTFSFIKGSSPIKIQTKKNFEIDVNVFKEKLDKVISTEIEEGSCVEKLHLGSLYLLRQLEAFDNSNLYKEVNVKFVPKGSTKIEYECDYYRISINHLKEIIYVFTTNFLLIKNDIGTTLDIVMSLNKEIDIIEKLIVA